jgi:hypothetical protein
MEKIMISMITIVIVVIFFWLLASIRAHLVMILEEFQARNKNWLKYQAPPDHFNCRSEHMPLKETPITKDMVNKIKNGA